MARRWPSDAAAAPSNVVPPDAGAATRRGEGSGYAEDQVWKYTYREEDVE